MFRWVIWTPSPYHLSPTGLFDMHISFYLEKPAPLAGEGLKRGGVLQRIIIPVCQKEGFPRVQKARKSDDDTSLPVAQPDSRQDKPVTVLTVIRT